MKKQSRVIIAGILSVFIFACEDSNTIASVNNKDISQKSFDAFLALKRIDKSNEKQTEVYLKQYLDREAMAMAIENSEFLTEESIAAELNEFKKEMLISRYFEQYLKDQVSDTAIRNYYAANVTNYETKRAQVSHILIRTTKEMSEQERKVKYSRAHEAYSKLMSGESFENVVNGYSEDKISAKKSGDLGWINEGAIAPLFSKKVFTELKKDEISEPFQTNFGFHIVKLTGEPATIKKPLKKVKGDIRYQLRKKVKDEEIKRLMSTVNVTQF